MGNTDADSGKAMVQERVQYQKLRHRGGNAVVPGQVRRTPMYSYKISLHSTCMDVCMGIVYRIIYLRACARACARDGTPGKLPANETINAATEAAAETWR